MRDRFFLEAINFLQLRTYVKRNLQKFDKKKKKKGPAELRVAAKSSIVFDPAIKFH